MASFVWALNKAHVLALNTAHVLRLNKADVLALNKAHVLRLNSKMPSVQSRRPPPFVEAAPSEPTEPQVGAKSWLSTRHMSCVSTPSVQSQHKGNHKEGRPKAASFVLALNTGHILLLRRKTCALLRAKTSALLRRKTCAVLRARTCASFRAKNPRVMIY